MSEEKEQRVYDVLNKLGIPHVRYEHPPVYTVEEAREHWQNIQGTHCKNLFLRNKKGNRHYLVILEHTKKADLKALERRLGEDRLSFASAERLRRILGIEEGAVSSFGLINDREKEVQVVVDSALKDAGPLHFHPNVNTVTVGIESADFEKFLSWCGNPVRYFPFE